MEELGILGYAGITAIAFFVGFIIKQTKIDSKWIPVFTLATGAGLGIFCYFDMVPDFAPNVIEAIARGIVSGAAATGIHQIWKQLGSGEASGSSDQKNGDI